MGLHPVMYGPSETEIGVLCMYFFGLYQAYYVRRGRVTHQAVPGECDTLTVTPATWPADNKDSNPMSACNATPHASATDMPPRHAVSAARLGAP